MVAIKAHFDGKVIVPDEPVSLQPQQRLVVHIDPVPEAGAAPAPESSESAHRERILSMLGAALRVPENPDPKFRNLSDDELWGE